jgi:hypothetical protein
MFEQPIVSFKAAHGFSLIGADLIVDSGDFPGVHIAVATLAGDFAKVTQQDGNVKIDRNSSGKRSRNCIFIGTLSHSPTAQSLKEAGRIDTGKIEGKWESWLTAAIRSPFDSYQNALVIIGSDKRGAIFGAYSLSQQIGVSP